MGYSHSIVIVSDIHYAGPAEQERGSIECDIIQNPILRLCTRLYRHFLWRRDPFAHNHLLDRFLEEAPYADYVVANGDYSCDTAFVGVSDPASYQSAEECLRKLRGKFGTKLRATIGDHELGKLSMFGGRGGLRMASWRCSVDSLGLQPLWKFELGNYLIVGIDSSLVALSVYDPEILPEERSAWKELHRVYMASLEKTFAELHPNQRMILFCHDPTAIPFLWRNPVIQSKAGQIAMTVIGHLHSPLILWKSRLLAGMPAIGFLGNTARRLSSALNQARYWKPFNVRLCPALAGIELLKDGGYYRMDLDPEASLPPKLHLYRMPWN